MKCVCGYEYDRAVLPDEVDDGDEPFIHIHSQLHIHIDYDLQREVYIYACPKCNTVKMIRDY